MPFTDYAGAGGKPVELYHFAQATPGGATDWYFTSAETAVTATIPGVNGGAPVTFAPVPMVRGRYASNEEAKTQNIDVTVAPEHPIAVLFARSGPVTPITLTIYGWQRDDTVSPTYPALFAGQVKAARATDTGSPAVATVTLQCGPYQDMVQRKLLTVLHQPTCNNALYGVRCQADRAAHTYTGSVLAADGTHAIIVLDATTAAIFAGDVAAYGHGRLQGGTVTIRGTPRTIIAQDCAAGTITLLQVIPSATAGDALTVTEGCDKTRPTCIAQFNNFAHFQGYEWVPTRNPFTGSVI